MKTTPDFWAAVRLVTFANLPLTKKNSRGLWRTVRVGPGGTLRLPNGQLWARFEAQVKRHGGAVSSTSAIERVRAGVKAFGEALFAASPYADSGGGRNVSGAILASLSFANSPLASIRRAALESVPIPLHQWPRRGRDGQPVTYAALRRLQRRTQRRLAMICGGEDVGHLVRDLQVYRTPSSRLQAITYNSRRFNEGHYTFWLEEDRRSETLESHLDGLFVRAAVGHLWPVFFRCARCGDFAVSRLKGRAAYCSDRCEDQGRWPRRREARKRAAQALREQICVDVRRLQEEGLPFGRAVERACETRGIGPRRRVVLFPDL
jgi:hypothetical protein